MKIPPNKPWLPLVDAVMWVGFGEPDGTTKLDASLREHILAGWPMPVDPLIAALERRATGQWAEVRQEKRTSKEMFGHPPQDYVVTLDTTCPPCGGRQWWFLCPATGRRCRKLFLPYGGRRFLCRQAYRLGYESQAITREARMQRRIGKLCVKLGGAWSVGADDLPPKPKWMRWPTYERMRAKAWQADDVVCEAFSGWAERFLIRHARRAP